jgi:hypothetical protein
VSQSTLVIPGIGLPAFGFYPYTSGPTASSILNVAYALETIYAAYVSPGGPIGGSTTIGLKGAGMDWLSYTSGGAQGNDLVQFADGPYMNVHAAIAVAGAATYGLDTALTGTPISVAPQFNQGSILDVFMATGNQLNQNLTMKYWVGLFNLAGRSLTASSDTIPATDFAAFRFSTNAGDVNWKCTTRDNATTQVVDSGVAVVNNSNGPGVRYRLTIAVVGDGTNVSRVNFSINGSQVASIAVNLPRATQLMIPSMQVHKEVTGAGELRSIMFSRIVQRIGLQ